MALGKALPKPGAGNGVALPRRCIRSDGRLVQKILYDRMETAVIGEDAAGSLSYNALVGSTSGPLWQRALGLPALSDQDQGKGRAALPLDPAEFVPQPQHS